MRISEETAQMLESAFLYAKGARLEFVTPELMLYAICKNKIFAQAFENCGGEIKELDAGLKAYIEEYMESCPEGLEYEPKLSQGAGAVLAYAWESACNSGRPAVELVHMIHAMYALEESYAVYYMRMQGVERVRLLQEMTVIRDEHAYVQGRKRLKNKKQSRNSQRGGHKKGHDNAEGLDHAEGFEDKKGFGNVEGFEDKKGFGNVEGFEDKKGFGNAEGFGNVEGFEDKKGFSNTEGFDNTEGFEDKKGFSNTEGFEDKKGFDHAQGSYNEEEAGYTDEYDDMPVQNAFWQRYAACLNEDLDGHNPLIGREEELERTMQILCRREKNNPLHIGEPGVGKTAIVYGLARLLNEGKVPKPLEGAQIFSLDLGSLLAGTQYRGDFEKRFQKVMDSIASEEKPIIYIDEIHNIIGAGAVNGGSFDVSNMLKPYLAAGHIRFIGATTYEEYKKHFEKNKSLVRRFQNIDIKEPEISDAVKILEGLKQSYEEFHGVIYEEGVLEYAVQMSAKYINERFLPDKAIDLIDEAGAYRRMYPLEGPQSTHSGVCQEKCQGDERCQENAECRSEGKVLAAERMQTVGTDLIDEILSKTCHIPKQAVEKDEAETLAALEGRLKKQIFGQDEAVLQAVNAVKLQRAGLLEENKPLASLLFAGPTGVGKTEIAKCLAKELGIRLIRFDMSEYEEKHAVAKLIGAPAGYVGYEEGGLLTEEIRKYPHAVLLLDEIEKAHADIYNILLQVMDYATLTDNQGRKADFRNVILIMTSNAGASRIGKPGIGFEGEAVKADAILDEVKRIFQPEFRNRLSKIVTFNSLDQHMAAQIVHKKLGELKEMLSKKDVEFFADEKAELLIRKKGISAEFGAREIGRVIEGEIKPLLVDELLFGALKDGGTCRLTASDGKFAADFNSL